VKSNHLILKATVVLITSVSMFACAQTPIKSGKKEIVSTVTPQTKKMKVEIWSDVMCPFCYIGKRKFEVALEQFKDKENIELVWKSFQLNADLKTDPSKNTIQHLAESKGWSMEYTRETIAYVTNMAKEVGLSYDFDKAVVANSFDAHRLIQMAKKEGRGDAAEERLFKAYFTEGKNTADHAILISIGKEIGLDELEVKNMLASKDFSTEVLQDIAESEKIGVTGVPFFVFDRKYAVSGAQDSKVFADTLKKAYADFIKN
jgi:predicted DsbA family dithiol-disulfide isomerase